MKSKKLQRLFRLLSVTVILVLSFSGCVVEQNTDSAQSSTEQITNAPEQTSNVNAPGTLPIVNEKINLTVGIEQNTSVEDWETNKQTLYLEDQTNIGLDFVVYPSGEMKTKLELVIAAGGEDLPDLLLGTFFTQDLLMPWAKAKMIVPVTEYYDTHTYFTKQSLSNSENYDLETVKKYITYYDGNIYGLFSLNETWNNQYSNARLNLYMPWLEKLGLEEPKTTEDLYNVLCAFRDKDPNGNGKADEIPLTTETKSVGRLRKFLMTPFVYTQDNYWITDNGKIDVAFRQDGWREGLKYANKLYSEGLLDPSLFSQDDAAMTVTLSQDPYAVGSFVRISSSNMSPQDPNRYLYTRAHELQGPGGQIVSSVTPAIPKISGVITKNCKNVEAAFLLMDYMAGEDMSIICRYGFEGDTWSYSGEDLAQQYVDFWNEFKAENGFSYPELYYGEGAVDKPGERVFISANWGKLQNTWWTQVGPNIMTQKVEDMFLTSTFNSEIEKLSYVNMYMNKHGALNRAKKYRNDDLIVAGLLYTEDEQKVIADYYTDICSYAGECWAAFVTGRMNINDDTVWNEYLSTLDKMNIDKCIEAAQSCYTRMN